MTQEPFKGAGVFGGWLVKRRKTIAREGFLGTKAPDGLKPVLGDMV